MGPHLFRYGKNADTAREEVDTFVASMGPHLFRYGKLSECQGGKLLIDCFNGATSFQIWKEESKEKTIFGLIRASMGPHLFRYGKFH